MITLFFKIVETTLTFSVIIMILFFLMHLAGKFFTAKCRYIIWVLVLFTLAIPVNIISNTALFTFEIPFTKSASTPQNVLSANSSKDANVSKVSSSDVTNLQQNQQFLVTSNVTNEMNQPNDSNSLTLSKESAPSTNSFKLDGAFILSILTWTWMIVAILYFLWHITIYLVYTTKMKKHFIPADNTVQEILSQLCTQEKITQIPKLFISTTASSPMLFGFFNSIIVIPENLESKDALAGIISHELTHYKRRDLWIKLLTLFTESLHWFNPLVHFASKQCDTEMELSCDERVLKYSTDEARVSYGNAMLDIVKCCHRKNTVLTTHFNPKKNSIKERFMNILDNTKKRPGYVFILLMFLVCILAGTLVACSSKNKDEAKSDNTVKAEFEAATTADVTESTEVGTLVANDSKSNDAINVDSTVNNAYGNMNTTDFAEATDVETEEGLFTPSGTAGILQILLGPHDIIAVQTQELTNPKYAEYTNVGKYPCTTSDATFLCGYSSKVLIKDGGYFIYDYKTDKAKEVLLSDEDYKSFRFVNNKSTEKSFGLWVKKSKVGDAAFYSFKAQQFITDFSYQDYYLCVRNYLFVLRMGGDECVLDMDTGKVLFETTLDTGDLGYISNDNGFYFLLSDGHAGKSYNIYDENFNLIIDKSKSIYSQLTLSDNGYVNVIDPDETTYDSYNQKGELVSRSRSYQKVFLLNGHYAGVVDTDNYLKIIDMNTGVELKRIVEWTDKMEFQDSGSSYKGLFIKIKDTAVAEDTKGYYKNYFYNPETGDSSVIQYAGN